MRNFITALLLLVVLSSYSQKRLNYEDIYVGRFANHMYEVEMIGYDSLPECGIREGEYVIEWRLDDGTRVDILTKEYAIEVDFADKWYEGVGQALYYSIKTNKKPALVLIIEKDSHEKYLDRLKMVAEKYGIKIYVIYSDFSVKSVEHFWFDRQI